MTRTRRALSAVAACAVAALTACGGDPAPDAADSSPSPTPASTKVLGAAECTVVPPAGKIARSGYALRYGTGDMTVSVTPADGTAQCVRFAKTGRPDPNVPPDTLLFTFAGDRGEGGQLEFLAVDLAGGVLPWPKDARARNPDAPITSTVGVSIDGVYYTSSTCTLKLQRVTEWEASGRFDCPQAFAQSANPLDPNDDITYDETPVPAQPPKTAKLSGLFQVTK
ncbi:hypothetical protein [Gordonia hydrophobica]|uniref:Lipoprotein n=1 Tax=Gordonia hydrophobica TaxID=40516 RepID=A0ABZ2U2T0_9ACTN|nr:hypothetical protein [Gordonia hydrophobica]MBM7367301.1 hypothetical protein [Gordonia hydrophobica]